MLPDNSLSQKVIAGKYLYPDGVISRNLTEDYEMGGIALQDTSRGLQYQTWFGHWDKTTEVVTLTPSDTAVPIPIFTESDVFEFSFSFDQNMRWVAGTFINDGTFHLQWYDPVAAAYVTTPFTGFTAFKLALDDKREIQINRGASDVLLSYIRNNNLYVRVQRERYQIEHLLQSDLPQGLRITNFGMTEISRMKWRLQQRRPGEKLPWQP